MASHAPLFTAWMNTFFESYYRSHPVNATFIGVHDHDYRLPDFSENGAGDTLAEMETLLERLGVLPQESLSTFERIDQTLAQGFLKIQVWEVRSNHFQRGNPSTYTGEAIFGLLSLFLTPFAPLEERVEAAIARMQAIPGFLEQARLNIRQAPVAWTQRAIRECQGALAFLEQGLPYLIQTEGIRDPRFELAAHKTALAFADYQSYLRDDLTFHSSGDYACGEQAFDLLMHWGHLLDVDGEATLKYARQQLEETQAYLEQHAADFGATTPEQALARLAEFHPTQEGYADRYRELWEAARQFAETRKLLTWPDFPILYVPQPQWARQAAPFLYFLFYRSPAAFNRPSVHHYLVTPIEAGLPSEEQERLLRETNDSVIKLNHVVHHGGIGHHVQNWHAYRSPSRIGQVAAVDCASRIAMFCGGTMAEGWAVYATELMAEAGFLTALERYSESQSRRRMCARAIVDVCLHQGRFSLEEAARFYEERAGMPTASAWNEAVKNSMFPGAAMMYLVGSDRIRQLRQHLSTRTDPFSIGEFHDRFLSFGSVPVELIAREMEKEALGA